MALRLLFLQTHYRQLMNFTWESLIATNNAYAKLEKTVRDLKQKNDPPVVKKNTGKKRKTIAKNS